MVWLSETNQSYSSTCQTIWQSKYLTSSIIEICCFLSVVNPYNVSVSVDNKEDFDFRTYLNMVLRVGWRLKLWTWWSQGMWSTNWYINFQLMQFLIGCIKSYIAGIAFTCSLNINNNVQFLNVRHNLINFV